MVKDSNNTADAVRKEIATTRKRRLYEYRDTFPEWSDAAVATKLGVAPNFFSQFKLKEGAKGRRGVGEVLARRMEIAADLPRYWFDDIVVAEENLSFREWELVKSFRKLGDDEQKHHESILHKAAGRSTDPEGSIETAELPLPSKLIRA